jgi:hypothetical protein
LSTSLTLSLTVKAAPGFALSAAPASLSIIQGASGTSTITVTPVNGFAGTASLAVSGLPPGVTAGFSPAGTGSTSKLTLTASASASVGAATVTVTGTSGNIAASATVALTVVAAPGFKLVPSVANVNVIAGGTGTAIVSITLQGGFSAAVALTAAGLPAGVTASFSPASTSASSTLTLTAASSAAASASQFTITGASGGITASVAMTVTVTPPPDFAITLAPASLSVVQGVKGAGAVVITPVNGFSGGLALSATGLPAGVTVSFSALNASGAPGVFLGTYAVSASAVVATSKVTVTAVSGGLSHSSVMNLTVVAPSTGTALVDLPTYYNVSAGAIDGIPYTNGGLDALGHSYSGPSLGASQSIGGTEFALGPLGVLGAISGQKASLPAGQYTSLKLLATGVNGNQPNQTFTVTYTDGTTASFTQSLSDWYTPQSYTGESKAVATIYRDDSTGVIEGQTFYLYGYSFNLNAGKTVQSISLPQNRNVVVLAITLAGNTTLAATTLVNLSTAFNGVGITSDGKAFTGGLDGVGYAYSGSLLQGTPIFSNVQFQIGAADKANVVSGASSAIALPAGKYSSLLLLATGVNGAQISQPFKIAYSDGTSVVVTQSLSDWYSPSNYPGEVTALGMSYRNTASGTKDSRTFQLYEYTLSLNNAKTVTSITLPANSNVKVFSIQAKP